MKTTTILSSNSFLNLLAATLALAAPAAGAAAGDRPPAPLFTGMGDLQHPVTTTSPLAQRYFNQGLTLLYNFNHQEAIRSFKAVAQTDPDCAMAWWGVACAYGPHVNAPAMTPEDNAKAWEALGKGLALKTKASPREQAYLDALARRYRPDSVENRAELDRAYADAMREVARNHPDDLDASVLFAEALMDTMPWDYWTRELTPKPATVEVIETLRAVLRRNPNHPGANHLYIHAVEAGPTPEAGLPSADRLREQVPQAGHLVHMPSHIYVRVGDYAQAALANERATKVDRDYIRQCAIQGFYPGVYYPHNVHFLWYVRSLQGRSTDALAEAKRAAGIAAENICGPTRVFEAPRFRHLPWLVHARFGQWDPLLTATAPPRTNDYLLDRAMWHYARGLAFVAKSRNEAARQELAGLDGILADEALKKLDNPQLPSSALVAIGRDVLAGKLAHRTGQSAEAIALLEKAVAAQDALPYMEPPYWYYPVRQSLGAVCLSAGQAARAESVFREDLQRTPRNGWSLLGLAKSLRRQGKESAADNVQREFEAAWSEADVKLDLSWL